MENMFSCVYETITQQCFWFLRVGGTRGVVIIKNKNGLLRPLLRKGNPTGYKLQHTFKDKSET